MKPFIAGVAGLSGSGKTALAQKLRQKFAPACEALTIDSYYHAQCHLALEQRAQLNYDHPDAIDWTLLENHLAALAGGESIEEPCYLFDRHTRGEQTRLVEPAPILILEGILTLHRAEIRRWLDLKVFVVTDAKECLRRRLERDIAERGRTRESVLEQYASTVWPMAVEYVLPSLAFADLVVSGEEPIDQAVTQVVQRLEMRAGARA